MLCTLHCVLGAVLCILLYAAEFAGMHQPSLPVPALFPNGCTREGWLMHAKTAAFCLVACLASSATLLHTCLVTGAHNQVLPVSAHARRCFCCVVLTADMCRVLLFFALSALRCLHTDKCVPTHAGGLQCSKSAVTVWSAVQCSAATL